MNEIDKSLASHKSLCQRCHCKKNYCCSARFLGFHLFFNLVCLSAGILQDKLCALNRDTTASMTNKLGTAGGD